MIQALGCAMFEQLAGQHAPVASRREIGVSARHEHDGDTRCGPNGVWKHARMLSRDTSLLRDRDESAPFVAFAWIGPCLRAVAFARRTSKWPQPQSSRPHDPQIEHTINPLKAAWRRFGTPVLVVLMALAIALTHDAQLERVGRRTHRSGHQRRVRPPRCHAARHEGRRARA